MPRARLGADREPPVSSLPRCEGIVVFGQLDAGLWPWVLPGLWPAGWPPASTASSASRATALGGAGGSLPCTMGPPTGLPLRPIQLPGTLQAPSPVRAQPALPCAPPSLLRSPTPSLASLPQPMPQFPLGSGSTHAQPLPPKRVTCSTGFVSCSRCLFCWLWGCGTRAALGSCACSLAHLCPALLHLGSINPFPGAPSTAPPAQAFPCGTCHLLSRDLELWASPWHLGTEPSTGQRG